MDWLHVKVSPSCLQVSLWWSAVVPLRRPLPDGRHRGSTTSILGLVTISGCAPYAAVDVRRPSFPGCHLSSSEQSATTRHICTVTACFSQSSEDPSLQPQFSLTILLCPWSDTRHYGHVNRCFYLLTYLLTVVLLQCYRRQKSKIRSQILNSTCEFLPRTRFVCLSVCPSVRLSHAWIVKKRWKDLFRFL